MKIIVKRNVKNIRGNKVIECTYDKALKLAENNKVRILEYKKENKKGKKIVLFVELIYKIGGIETWLLNMVSYFKDYDITIYYKQADEDQLLRLAEFCSIKEYISGVTKIDCDILLLANFYSDIELKRCANKTIFWKKCYMVIHADFRALSGIKITRCPLIDEYLFVSHTAREGLKECYGIDGRVIYNFVNEDYYANTQDKTVYFLTLSRFTAEKGADRIIKLARMFKDNYKHFIWFVCGDFAVYSNITDVKALESIPEIILLPPSLANEALISRVDYVVQTSDSESYCYSLHQALSKGIAVIATNFEEAKNFIKDGENGYILEMDLSNVDVNKIFNKIPKNVKDVDLGGKEAWREILDFTNEKKNDIMYSKGGKNNGRGKKS